jgi:hypothetical protein
MSATVTNLEAANAKRCQTQERICAAARVARWYTYFLAKNPNFDTFWKALERIFIKKYMALWYILWYFVHFVVFWYIFFPFDKIVPTKIWQPWPPLGSQNVSANGEESNKKVTIAYLGR